MCVSILLVIPELGTTSIRTLNSLGELGKFGAHLGSCCTFQSNGCFAVQLLEKISYIIRIEKVRGLGIYLLATLVNTRDDSLWAKRNLMPFSLWLVIKLVPS